jgi:tetratricopeptide (TPR) repeat protein
MKTRRTFLAILFVIAGEVAQATEHVLFLKNGRRIVVDRYWEEGEQILYERDGSTFGFPRKLLESVESGGATGESAPAAGEASGFRNAVVDESLAAARDSAREGNVDEAVEQYRRAIESEPSALDVRVELGRLYLERGDVAAAQGQFEQAKRIAPEDLRAREGLGDVYYRMGRLPLAIREWQAALSIEPDPGILYKLKKALRENNEDIDFEEVSHPHFLIRYDGQVNDIIGRIMAAALEEEYYDLTRALRFTPRSAVKVTLYTNQEFRDVTHAPTWASGLNDGEIRIPVEGVTEMTPKLRRVLRHELTHSFINAMTSGNCPSWFHEGVAQLHEGSDRIDPYPRLRTAQAEGGLLPLWSLEGPLLNYSKDRAILAYAEALAATEYLEARKGRAALLRILQLLGERHTMNDALKKVVGLDYQELQTAWEADLERTAARDRQ